MALLTKWTRQPWQHSPFKGLLPKINYTKQLQFSTRAPVCIALVPKFSKRPVWLHVVHCKQLINSTHFRIFQIRFFLYNSSKISKYRTYHNITRWSSATQARSFRNVLSSTTLITRFQVIRGPTNLITTADLRRSYNASTATLSWRYRIIQCTTDTHFASSTVVRSIPTAGISLTHHSTPLRCTATYTAWRNPDVVAMATLILRPLDMESVSTADVGGSILPQVVCAATSLGWVTWIENAITANLAWKTEKKVLQWTSNDGTDWVSECESKITQVYLGRWCIFWTWIRKSKSVETQIRDSSQCFLTHVNSNGGRLKLKCLTFLPVYGH